MKALIVDFFLYHLSGRNRLIYIYIRDAYPYGISVFCTEMKKIEIAIRKIRRLILQYGKKKFPAGNSFPTVFFSFFMILSHKPT